jgi:hypothetical protein
VSKLTEYLEAAVGYNSEGLPASSTQFTIGLTPFMLGENENIDDVTQITAACTSDAVVDIDILDDIAKVTFDFTMEPEVLSEFLEELETYMAQRQHVTEAMNELMADLHIAEKNGDESAAEELMMKLRSTSVPFMLPTIMPVDYDGSVQIGFQDDPKFIFYTTEQMNTPALSITMIFDASDLFCQDELAIYTNDIEEELEAQREELWYMDEARRIEEENYRAQWGYDPNDYDDDNNDGDNRMKGVRIK